MNIHEAEEKLRGVIRRRHLAYSTEESYVGWMRRFAGFVAECSPIGTPAEKMERFLTQLARQEVPASSQNQASNVATTIGYCHAEACSVPSPLSVL